MVSTLTVDLDAVAHNLAAVRAACGEAEVAPVVKADAYGLGAGPVARRLWAEGARSFFVARTQGGVALRDLLPSAEIFVLDGCLEGDEQALIDHRLKPVLNSLEQVARWSAVRGGAAALHVDTGMNRLGLRTEEAQTLAASPDRLRGVDLDLVMSHLACASEPLSPMNAAQAARFAEVAERFPGVRRSLANSGGVFLGDSYAFDLVRPGIALYGGGPTGAPDARLQPVVTLEAPILQRRVVPAGESVGYGAAWRADKLSHIAVIGAGYADGVLRSGSPGAYAMAGGRRCAVIGRISMDLTAIDVTDAPEAREGSCAFLLSPDLPVDDLAAASGTLAYEVLTRIGARVRRRYVGAGG